MDLELLTTREAAEILHVSHRTLERWRINGEENLAWIKYKGVVRYQKSALSKFVERQTRGK